MQNELLGIVLNTLYVSTIPTFFSTALGTPIAVFLKLKGGTGAEVVKAVFNGLIGMPTVLLGLLLYLLLARSGPLGFLQMLYTLDAVVLGHTLLVLPLYIAFALTALDGVDPRVRELAKMFQLPPLRTAWLYIREAAAGLIAAAMAAFGRAVGELGLALMLGGDIRYRTRVLTTAIAHETMLGNWDTAIQLGIILLTIALAVSLATTALGFRFRG